MSKISNLMLRYERGDHNCLEETYNSHDTIWRCKVCLRETPTAAKSAALLAAFAEDTIEWFESERRSYPITNRAYTEKAEYSSICPECSKYINKYNSRVVRLRHPHPNRVVEHDNGKEYDVGGYIVHADCFEAMLRERPCRYCGITPAGTVDYVTPLHVGGSTEPFNMVASCQPCNSSKGIRHQTNYELNKQMRAQDSLLGKQEDDLRLGDEL